MVFAHYSLGNLIFLCIILMLLIAAFSLFIRQQLKLRRMRQQIDDYLK